MDLTMSEKLQILNVLLVLFGWIVGALLVIVTMRAQMTNLTDSINRLALSNEATEHKVDGHDTRIARLEGFKEGQLAAAASRAILAGG